MSLSPSPFDSNAVEGTTHHIVRMKPDRSGKQELVSARWGSNPRFSDGIEFRFIRAEGKTFPTNRCLMPASEFHMQVGNDRYRVRLEDGNFFYLACVWEPQIDDWPLSFRIITVASNPEVSRFQDRHGAIVFRRQAQHWLDGHLPEAELLVTPPANIFVVEEIGSESVPARAGAIR